MRISDWSSDVCSSDLEYMTRGHRANEAAIMTLGRAIISLDHQITRSGMIVALRFRQLLFLEAAAASLIVGLFVLFPDMPTLMRLIILVLTPITLAGGGFWFANHALAIGEALGRHARRWNRSEEHKSELQSLIR